LANAQSLFVIHRQKEIKIDVNKALPNLLQCLFFPKSSVGHNQIKIISLTRFTLLICRGVWDMKKSQYGSYANLRLDLCRPMQLVLPKLNNVIWF